MGLCDSEHTLEITGRPLLLDGLQAREKQNQSFFFHPFKLQTLFHTHKEIFIPACKMVGDSLTATPFGVLNLLLGVVGVEGEGDAGCREEQQKENSHLFLFYL